MCTSIPLLTILRRDTADALIKSTLSPEAIRKLKLKEEIIAHHREHVKIHQPRSYTTCRKNGYELGGVSLFLL